MKYLFVEARSDADFEPIIRKHLNKIKEKKLGLVSTVQHAGEIEKVKKILEGAGKKVFTTTGERTVHDAQVLGCDVSAAQKISGKVGAFVYLGGGDFHPLRVGERTGKKVYCLHPSSGLDVLRQEKIKEEVRKKRLKAAKASKQATFGVLVSTKPGQEAMRGARDVVKTLRKKGRTALIFVGDDLSPSFLNDFSEVGAWVNTACPRISDDYDYNKPVVNWEDLKELF